MSMEISQAKAPLSVDAENLTSNTTGTLSHYRNRAPTWPVSRSDVGYGDTLPDEWFSLSHRISLTSRGTS